MDEASGTLCLFLYAVIAVMLVLACFPRDDDDDKWGY